MSWKSLIREQVANAFTILDDLVSGYLYRDKSGGVLVDGEYSYADSETGNLQGVLTNYDTTRIDGRKVMAGDKELILLVSELASISNDAEFDDPDGNTWTVMDKNKDPSETIWTVQLRAG